EDHLDRSEVEAETRRVGQPEVGVGPDVEEHRALLARAAPGDEYGIPVAGAAEPVEYHLARMPVMRAADRQACEVVRGLRHLRDALGGAPQRGGLVVHPHQTA